MWTRGKDPKAPGRFAYELFTDTGVLIEARGGFESAQACDRAAELAQRAVLFGGLPVIDDDTASMSNADLLAELLA